MSNQPRLDNRDYESLGHSAYYSATLQHDAGWRKAYAKTAINYYTTAVKMGGWGLDASIEKARKLLDKE